MRPSFHPRLINGPFGDPGLLVNLTFEKQALLFDLGELSALAPNDILKISRVFVSHTHMDHFIGFDQLLRLLLGRDKKIHLYGPTGFLDNLSGKLRAYTWNLVQNYTEALVIEATEIADGRSITQTFDCRNGFRPSDPHLKPLHDGIVHQEPAHEIRTSVLDHQIPSLAYSLQEHFHVNILKSQLDDLGLNVGPWLTEFKNLLFQGADPATEVRAPGLSPEHEMRSFALEELSARIARITRGQKIAYVADVGYCPSNEEKIVELAQGVDHLFIEAAFLDAEQAIAQAKYHLTARQAGLIARKARAKQMTIFHHSPRYTGQAHLLEQEARQAFEGR